MHRSKSTWASGWLCNGLSRTPKWNQVSPGSLRGRPKCSKGAPEISPSLWKAPGGKRQAHGSPKEPIQTPPKAAQEPLREMRDHRKAARAPETPPESPRDSQGSHKGHPWNPHLDLFGERFLLYTCTWLNRHCFFCGSLRLTFGDLSHSPFPQEPLKTTPKALPRVANKNKQCGQRCPGETLMTFGPWSPSQSSQVLIQIP